MLDGEHLQIVLPPNVPPLHLLRLGYSTLSGYYNDDDNMEVNQILHFVDDRLSWEERFRSDSGVLQIEFPTAEDLTRLELG